MEAPETVTMNLTSYKKMLENEEELKNIERKHASILNKELIKADLLCKLLHAEQIKGNPQFDYKNRVEEIQKAFNANGMKLNVGSTKIWVEYL